MNWKEFFYLQRESKVAVTLLLILIVITLFFNAFNYSVNSSEIVLRHNDSIINEFKSITAQRRTTHSGNYVNSQQRPDSASSVNKPSTNANVENQRRFTNNNYVRIEKLSPGETISLNSSDTTEWKKIPGIGSSYSTRIVKYRTLLGGFINKNQLLEVYGIDSEMYSRISPYITEDPNFTKIKVNELEFNQLLRHPYLNYGQVQAIINLRDKKGNISSTNELSMLDEFTKDDISRLQPYLEFRKYLLNIADTPE